MNKRSWTPWIVVGTAILIAAVGYPFYFDWWDRKNCRDSGGNWIEERGECVEPRNSNIPNTSGSRMHEDDNQGGDKPRE